jgi:hypothetical protein
MERLKSLNLPLALILFCSMFTSCIGDHSGKSVVSGLIGIALCFFGSKILTGKSKTGDRLFFPVSIIMILIGVGLFLA